MKTLKSNNKAVNIAGLTFIGVLTAFAYHATLLWVYQRYMGAGHSH